MGGLKRLLLTLLWILEGVLVGFGAILPGISGGTLCVAFGMYRPAIETISHPFRNLKKYGWMLVVFFVGVGAGFVGLSALAEFLMQKNTTLVVCAFIGFILGTVPELWQDAGQEGRSTRSYVGMGVAFVVMVGLLTMLKTAFHMNVAADMWGFALCGVMWGLSFIVPGLSSSSLILFFDLYEPMLKGISTLDFAVLIPMAVGGLLCLLLLSKAVGFAYKKQYSLISHSVLGIVVATAVMILPIQELMAGSVGMLLLNLAVIVCGGVVSYTFTRICAKLKQATE